jgi:hypothetical protein
MCLADWQVIRGLAGERAANRRWRLLSDRWKEGATQRRFRRGIALAALATLLSLPISGCGGGGSSSTTASTGATGASGATGAGGAHGKPGQQGPTSDQGPPSATTGGVQVAIQQALAPDDSAAACREFVTPAYLKAAYGGEEGCEQAVQAGGTASSVRVEGIYVNLNAGTAKANATPTGGPNDGETLHVQLVLEGNTWKVDSVESNAPVGP